MSKELIAASTRPLVLAILSKGENYGYAIIQQVRELSGGDMDWSEGMLYPVLHRLEQQQLIVSRWGDSESGKKRKYYRLSDSGARALQADRQQWFAVHATLTSLWGTEPCFV